MCTVLETYDILRLLRNRIVAFAYLEFGRINGQNAGY